MTPNILTFLSEMVNEIFTIVGLAYIPLIVNIIFRAGRLRGLTDENMAERLGDLCFDTLREEIKKQIEGLLQIYFNNALVLPPGKRIQDIDCNPPSSRFRVFGATLDHFSESY